MKLKDLIGERRAQVERLSNQHGAVGERAAIDAMANWIPRPRGRAMKNLKCVLEEAGTPVKASCFDAISVGSDHEVDFDDLESLTALLPSMVFIEIKTATQERVKPGFSGYFFALTEGEIEAAEMLGGRHRVALFNRLTDELLLTSVGEILARARSMTWQLSVQL